MLSPYGVTGNSSASSATAADPAAPYRLQDEENRKRSTPACLGRPGQLQRPVQVHRVRRRRVEVAERVVGQRRQADHRVVAGELPRRDVPHVAVRLLRRRPASGRAEVAPFVQAEVEPVDLVPGRAQERHQHGPDVSAVARDEDSHHYPQGSGIRVAGTARPSR